MEQTGLRNLTGLFLGGRVTKGPQTSNWARLNLSPSQLCYAATDAWVCLGIVPALRKPRMVASATASVSRTEAICRLTASNPWRDYEIQNNECT